MMQRIEADPSFWLGLTAVIGLAFTAVGALLGLLIAWAKAKTAEIEARDAKAGLAVQEKSIDRVEQAAGTVAAQVSTHAAQIAALQTQQAQSSPAGQMAAPSADLAFAQTAAQVAAQMAAQQTAAPQQGQESGGAGG